MHCNLSILRNATKLSLNAARPIELLFRATRILALIDLLSLDIRDRSV